MFGRDSTRWIRKVRNQMQKEMEGMTAEEVVQYHHQNFKALCKKYNLTIKTIPASPARLAREAAQKAAAAV
jgi:hypothetical protein